MKITATTYLLENLLRQDIVVNLSHDGIEAVLDWYDGMDEEREFDQSLFWCFHRYESALAAVMDFNANVVEEIVNDLKEENPDEPVNQDDVELECKQWLTDNTNVIPMDDGSVIVDTEF